jgi:hypothetical protein
MQRAVGLRATTWLCSSLTLHLRESKSKRSRDEWRGELPICNPCSLCAALQAGQQQRRSPRPGRRRCPCVFTLCENRRRLQGLLQVRLRMLVHSGHGKLIHEPWVLGKPLGRSLQLAVVRPAVPALAFAAAAAVWVTAYRKPQCSQQSSRASNWCKHPALSACPACVKGPLPLLQAQLFSCLAVAAWACRPQAWPHAFAVASQLQPAVHQPSQALHPSAAPAALRLLSGCAAGSRFLSAGFFPPGLPAACSRQLPAVVLPCRAHQSPALRSSRLCSLDSAPTRQPLLSHTGRRCAPIRTRHPAALLCTCKSTHKELGQLLSR